MSNIWLKELWQIFWLIAFVLFWGVVFNEIVLFLTLVLAAIVVWYLYNLHLLSKWLQQGKKYSPPKSMGIFDGLFNDLYRRQQRQRKRQKRLVKLLSRINKSTKAMPDGIIILQKNGEIEWWNSAALGLISLNYPQDIGQRITNLLRQPEFIRLYNRTNKQKSIKLLSPVDEQKIISIRIIPYGNKQQLVMIRDITLLQRVEDMQRDFIANISHELRTPITVMSGFLEELTQHKPENEAQWQHYIRLMLAQSSRMHNLVEDLMVLSRLESHKTKLMSETVAVPSLLFAIKEQAEILSKQRQHSIILHIDENLYLRGDIRALESAFTNLVFNAVNYSAENTEILIRWFEDEYGAHFSVSDKGIGIPQYHIPRLTERFYRVDVSRSRESGGSGLGLAIVNTVVARHEGKLTIDSVVGQGSTFNCNFPQHLIVSRNGMTGYVSVEKSD